MECDFVIFDRFYILWCGVYVVDIFYIDVGVYFFCGVVYVFLWGGVV